MERQGRGKRDFNGVATFGCQGTVGPEFLTVKDLHQNTDVARGRGLASFVDDPARERKPVVFPDATAIGYRTGARLADVLDAEVGWREHEVVFNPERVFEQQNTVRV